VTKAIKDFMAHQVYLVPGAQLVIMVKMDYLAVMD